MSFQFLDKLSKDFTELLNDKEEYNVVIEVDKEVNKKSFTAHSTVLRYRSSYFRKELANTVADKNRIKTIIMPNIPAKVFDVILRYIYGGVINLENSENKFVFDLMKYACEFEFEELSKKLEYYLIKNKATWLRAHFFYVYHSIFDKNNHFKNLENFCNNIIAKYPSLLFDSEDFISIKELALISILKRDDIQVEEIKIWDKVIQWGVAQMPILPSKLEEWSDEDFAKLKKILQQCLQHIRYFQLSAEDVFDKLEPYKKILEEQLWNDVVKKLIFPNRSVNSIILPARSIVIPVMPNRTKEPFSTIINDEHAAEISSWIDRKSTVYPLLNNPYEFRLILRGSRDGFNPQTFWNITHGHARTVIVLKVEGTDEILGGYNPLKWDNTVKVGFLLGGSWINTAESFVFSLKNGNIPKSLIRRVKNNQRAVLNRIVSHQDQYGPAFGSNVLAILTNGERKFFCGTNKHQYYEGAIRTQSGIFGIVDYEVFDIVTDSN